AGRRNAVTELHRVVDLVDQQAAIRVLEYIHGEHAAANRVRSPDAQIVQFGRHRAVGGFATTRRVGDPVLGIAVDGANALVPDDKGADVTAWLADHLLDVNDAVLV